MAWWESRINGYQGDQNLTNVNTWWAKRYDPNLNTAPKAVQQPVVQPQIGPIIPPQQPSGMLVGNVSPNTTLSTSIPQVPQPVAGPSNVPETPIPRSEFKQGTPDTTWDKIKSFFDRPFKDILTGQSQEESDKEKVAKAQATLATGNLIAEKLNVPIQDIDLTKVSDNLDAYTKELGVRTQLNGKEFGELMVALTAPYAIATAGVVPVAVGFAKFSLYSTALDAVAHLITGKPMGEGLKSFLPDNAPQSTKDLAGIIDLLGKVYITHKMSSVEPKIADFITKRTIIEYKLPQTVSIKPEEIKAIQAGENTANSDYLKQLGWTSKEWKDAYLNGTTIEIPTEKVVRIVDTPFWKAIKNFVGLPETNTVVSDTGSAKPTKAPAGLLTEGNSIDNAEKPIVTENKKQSLLDNIITKGVEDMGGKVTNTIKLSDGGYTLITDRAKISFTEHPDTIEIQGFYRGENGAKGEPTKLLNDIKQYANEKGKSITATHITGNDIEYWKKVGFEPIDVSKGTGESWEAIYSPKETPQTPANPLPEIKSEVKPKVEQPKVVNKTGEVVNKVVKQPEVKPVETVQVPKSQLPVGTGKQKYSRLAERMRSSLEGLTEEQRKSIPTFNQMNIKEQRELAAQYVTDNPEEAMQVLRGEKEAPNGLLYNSVFKAMQESAKVGENVSLIQDLASLQSTRFGQELRTLVGSDPYDPVNLLQEIRDVKIKAFERKTGKKYDQHVKETLKKVGDTTPKVKKDDWLEFIKSIEC